MPAHRLRITSSASGRAVYLDHAAIDDHEDNNIDRPHGYMNEQGLQPQPQQRAKPQRFQRGLQVGKHGLRNVR